MLRLSLPAGAAFVAAAAEPLAPGRRRSAGAASAASGAATPCDLELRDLACLRGERLLFTDVSMRVGAGELLRVRGPNGAGKTSLLRIVCGLAAPHRGSVRWCGVPLADQREAFNAGLVYLGDGAALNDRLSAHENLLAASAIAGRHAAARDADAALADAGLGAVARLPVRVLSQGQRRRAALARLALPAVAAEPGLWVLDEPFNALDDAAGRWLTARIRGQLAAGGIVVLTSHQDAALGADLTERVIRL